MVYIDPLDLHKHWPAVREDLESLIERYPQDWIPEDVYAAIRSGVSTLHIVEEGFLVLTPQRDYDGMVLFIWIAYGRGEVYEKYMPELEKMARQINARKIRFKSTRRWDKRFDYVTSIYERKL